MALAQRLCWKGAATCVHQDRCLPLRLSGAAVDGSPSLLARRKDAKKKAELKKQLDQLMAKLNENNQAMTKVYGFSLTRNYIIDVEASSIYLIVSDEEAKQIEKEQKAKTGKK